MSYSIAAPIVVFVLFYLLTPGILLRLPPNSSKHVVAITHAVVFTIVFNIIYYVAYKKPASAINSISSIVLFYLLTPGILVTIPRNGNKESVAAVHGIIFTLLHCVICHFSSPRSSK